MLWHTDGVRVGGRVRVWESNFFLNSAVPLESGERDVNGPKAALFSVRTGSLISASCFGQF